MAEAIHITGDNYLEVKEFVDVRAKLIRHYGRNIGNIQSEMSLGRLPTDGYFVFESGTMDYLTVDEFSEMYKPCPGLWHD